MPKRPLVIACLWGCSWVLALAPRAARAQPGVGVILEPPAEPAPPQPRRPRMAVAVGMGTTFDSAGFSPARTTAVPSFSAVGDIGDGTAGFAMGVYASTANGRYRAPDMPVDRLGLDIMAVLRLLGTRFPPTDTRYRARVARAAGVELGLGYERDGQGALAGGRFGVHTGIRLELPLTPADQKTEVRLHLAARRLNGLYQPIVNGTVVGDSNELYAALAVVF